MAKLNDTKIPITRFLEAYKRQECLYNSVLDTYKNRSSREEAHEQIIRELNIPHLTVLDVKLKIKSIRTVYTKELRTLMRENELGKKYEPKLFWFKLADSFLRSVSLSSCKGLKRRLSSMNQEISRTNANSNTTVVDLMEDAMDESGYNGYDTSIANHNVERNVRSNSVPVPVSLTSSDGNNAHTAEVRSNISLGSIDIRCLTGQKDSACLSNKSEVITDECLMEPIHHSKYKSTPIVQNQQYPQYLTSRLPIPFSTTPVALKQHQQQQQQQHHENSDSPACFGVSNGTINSLEEDFISFGNSIASQLRSIPDAYARSVAKLRIQQVLFEAETGHFQNAEPVSLIY